MDMKNSDINPQWVTDLDGETADAIVALMDCAAADGGTLGYAEPISAEESAGFVSGLRRRISAGESHVLIGRVDRQLVFLAILTLNGMPNCRHRAELSKGVVHPDYRGRQCVQMAFRELVQRAEALGVEQLVLDVREDTRAHALWQRFGFQSFGVLPDYARVKGASYQGHFMAQSVASLRARLAFTTTTST
jgi:ribosomal protein S18 acetylase RimI-like enzyme